MTNTTALIASIMTADPAITPETRAAVADLLAPAGAALDITPEKELSEDEAARTLGLSRMSLMRWRKTNTPPRHRGGLGFRPAAATPGPFPFRYRKTPAGSFRYYAPDVVKACRQAYTTPNETEKAC